MNGLQGDKKDEGMANNRLALNLLPQHRPDDQSKNQDDIGPHQSETKS